MWDISVSWEGKKVLVWYKKAIVICHYVGVLHMYQCTGCTVGTSIQEQLVHACGHSPVDSKKKKKRLTTIAYPVYELLDEPSNLTMCIVIHKENYPKIFSCLGL